MNVSIEVPFIDHCVYRAIINCDPILKTVSCHRVLFQAKNVPKPFLAGLCPGHSTGELTTLPGPHNRRERGTTPNFPSFDAFGASIERARKSLRHLA